MASVAFTKKARLIRADRKLNATDIVDAPTGPVSRGASSRTRRRRLDASKYLAKSAL